MVHLLTLQKGAPAPPAPGSGKDKPTARKKYAKNIGIPDCPQIPKWLKDRKGRELSYEDIFHYQKIIVALSETSRLMAGIDKIEIE